MLLDPVAGGSEFPSSGEVVSGGPDEERCLAQPGLDVPSSVRCPRPPGFNNSSVCLLSDG